MTLPEFSVLLRLVSGWRADWEQQDIAARAGIDYWYTQRFHELLVRLAGEDE